MNGTTDLAVRRNGGAPAAQQGTALAIRSGQSMWDDKQRAALVAMGVSEKATNAELAVFFHQCQRTQLDPFSKQIYFIHRRTKEGDRWVDKPTTQIGIDGFRVIRDRIADKKGLRVEYEDTIWYDADRVGYDVWVEDEPPAACKVVVLVDGRRFPSVLRFNEYCQRNRDGDRLGRWRDGHAHQIEKCAEADALRKAFPNDMAGLILEDAAPLGDPDAPATLSQDRPRVTAAQVRQTVTAEVVTPDAASGDAPPPKPSPEAASNPDAPVTAAEVTRIIGHFHRIGWGNSPEDQQDMLRQTARIARTELKDYKGLTIADAEHVCRELARFGEGDAQGLMDYLNDGVAPDGD